MKGQPVCVVWVDSQTAHGWTDPDDLPSAIETTVSIGFLIDEGEEQVRICMTAGEYPLQPMAIPRCAIQAMFGLQPEDGAEELGGDYE